MPLGWLFGVGAFLLNFIPSVGSVIAVVLPLPVVLFDDTLGPGVKVMAFAIPAVIQFVLGNVLAPKLMGDSLDLSPVSVMLALLLFGAVWGVAGMFLATPILCAVKIALDRIEPLKPVAEALAGRFPHT